MDAPSYLEAVKSRFNGQPDLHARFLDIVKAIENEQFEIEDIIHRVSQLFHGDPVLIQGFNTLLPVGYQIEYSSNPQDRAQSKVGLASDSSLARRDIGYGTDAEHAGRAAPASIDGQSIESFDSYGVYKNLGLHASGQGTINNINSRTNNYNYSPSNPLAELRKYYSPTAAVDSASRFNPPRCAESTRLRVTQTIEGWINSDEDEAVPLSLFWLYGGAGVGKSAIAQSLSEKFQEKEQLLASFFFSRDDSSRNNGDHLIPTLVSHLVHSFEEVIPFVEDRILKHWDLFTKSYQTQIRELLIMPLRAVNLNGRVATQPPRLIVIDGLDECQNTDVQCELLRVISRAIPQIPYPVRFFITSRPEAHITNVFDHDRDLHAIKVHRYNLSDDPDEDMDIRKYVEKEFEEIRRVDPDERHLPHTWLDQGAIDTLVERSSGNFTYASTVIRYIRSQKRYPVDLQEAIHRLSSLREGDRPNAQLEASKDQQDSHANGCTGSANRSAVGPSVGQHDSYHEGNSPNDHLQSSDMEVSPCTHKDTQRDSCKKKVDSLKSPRQTAFLAACRNGHERIVKLLLSRNDVDINSRDEDGQTALFAASREGHEAVVKLLLSQNDVAINATAIDSDLFGTYPGRTALLAASYRGHDGIVKSLLSRNDVDTNFQDEGGQTALFLASCHGHEGVVKQLLTRDDVDVNLQDTGGRTALFEACRGGHEAVVKAFLSRRDVRINATATDSDEFGTYPGRTALLAASRWGCDSVVELLLSRNDVDVNSQGEDGQSALFLASCYGHEEVVRKLLTRDDVSVNAPATDSDVFGICPGRTALLAASQYGHDGVVELLLSRNDVDVNLQDTDGHTALFEACREGSEAVVKVLLSRKDVRINAIATDSDVFGTYLGRTALLVASSRGHDGIVKLLLSRNDLDINLRDEDGQTALFLASCCGHESVVKSLLSRDDVDINSQNTDGHTALFEACRGGHEAVVEVLLSRNDLAINTTAIDSDVFGTYPGRTALLAASSRGHDGIVKLLLSRTDVDVNSEDDDGQTALLLASYHGHEATVELLLSRNAM